MVGNDTIHTVTRKEHDCIGYMDVPKDVYWGIHTQRALGNFTVSRIADSTHPQLMRAYATVKRACAEANDELGLIDHDKARLIVAACHDVENGELADQFPVDVLQGGAGTSTNMNMNEVIANRALELGGHPKGDYGFIHPNDDVNHSQSTNDTYPAACKLALIDRELLRTPHAEHRRVGRQRHHVARPHGITRRTGGRRPGAGRAVVRPAADDEGGGPVDDRAGHRMPAQHGAAHGMRIRHMRDLRGRYGRRAQQGVL